ncbi:MAG: hypothetical protein U9Q66_01620 [Patescibacteria group bacterium]|nr:hypothetical protein [Patescibacteria group bacterium]
MTILGHVGISSTPLIETILTSGFFHLVLTKICHVTLSQSFAHLEFLVAQKKSQPYSSLSSGIKKPKFLPA